MRLDKEEPAININVSSYTSRKLKYFLRGIDMSGYDIKQQDTGEIDYGYNGSKGVIKITPKD